ncbi:TolC family protein [Dyadobacter psychrotolerans]|uniref:TolC family protein n=1 Tax=Dyadobacter psychrotolerans TaxID=2541721 RepID=A0A4R5DYC4_9BACT|nr:TolC family protein [Dyadobacter psychrotolerans]TDE16153.1 TolC family protein [Dyadobacter psychrotolerans]
MKARIVLIFLSFFMGSIGSARAQDTLRLKVEDLFKLAESGSRLLKLSAIRIQEAETGADIAKNQLLPDIDVAVSAGYLSNVGVIGMGTMKSGFYDMPHFSNSYLVQASYLLFSGGSVRRDIEISELRSRIAGLNFEKDKMGIKLLMAGYYLDLYRLIRQRAVYERNIDQANLLLEKINTRLKAGILLKSDKIRSELLLEDMKLQLVRVSSRIRIVSNAMAETLSLPEGTIIEPDPTLPAVANSAVKLDNWTQTAVQTEPDIQINELNKQTAQKRQQQVRAAYLPQASLYASNGLARPYVYDIPAKDIYANNLNVGLRLNYSLGGLYKNKARMAAATQGLTAAVQQSELVMENTRKAVFNAYTLWVEAGQQLASEQKKLELATENYRRILNGYEQQVALITDMTDASNQKLETELQLTTAQTMQIMRYFELQKVTGQLN